MIIIKCKVDWARRDTNHNRVGVIGLIPLVDYSDKLVRSGEVSLHQGYGIEIHTCTSELESTIYCQNSFVCLFFNLYSINPLQSEVK